MTRFFTQKEQEALLGRPVEGLITGADRDAFAGRSCVITGAGGSVGAELARQVAACRPSVLVLVEHSEHALFQIERELAEQAPGVRIEPALCDVTRASTVRRLLGRIQPAIVFHAAAYKHVTMAERAIVAAARVNVLGTSAVLAAAHETGAQFVLISSDKAAAPQSVMGATKRLAELATLARPARSLVVRFGNVLGSSGSFVQVARDRIERGLPLLVTDPSATRYLMTVTEAAMLVLKATAMARGGEIFWLDVGEQVRIGDLATRLLQTMAARGHAAVPIQVIGLRPGEKRTEQLTSHGVSLCDTDTPQIWVARHAVVDPSQCAVWLRALRRAIATDDAVETLRVLASAVEDFVPSEHARAIARTGAEPHTEPATLRVQRVSVPGRASAAPVARLGLDSSGRGVVPRDVDADPGASADVSDRPTYREID